ncbi:MAG: calcium-binding protein [Nitrosomonas sp.]|nr:MAG: calcium-binding protein [Nitrosomonas sp.]
MTFHLFHINEIYSNADGAVQFIELVGDSDHQGFWTGHSLTSSDGTNTNTYSFTTDLPNQATNGKAVLVATQGFADLGIVTPDYIIPNGFLFTTNGTVNFPGLQGGPVSYAALSTVGSLVVGSGSTVNTPTPTNFAGITGSLFGNVISGTDGPDNLSGTAGSDGIQAGAANDTINGGTGDDTINGGAGIDTAVFSSALENYSVSGTTTTSSDLSFTVSGIDGNDTLFEMERLRFTDKNLALDLKDGQAANSSIRIIGAAFGPATIEEHPDYVGVGLNLFDSGQSMLNVSQLAVDVMGNLPNDDFVDTVYQNVVGTAPSVTDHDFFTGWLEDGVYTQAQLLEIAANTEINAISTGLEGYLLSGIAFV